MASLLPIIKDILPILMPSTVHVTKASELDSATGQTDGMIRKGAIIGKSDKICASGMSVRSALDQARPGSCLLLWISCRTLPRPQMPSAGASLLQPRLSCTTFLFHDKLNSLCGRSKSKQSIALTNKQFTYMGKHSYDCETAHGFGCPPSRRYVHNPRAFILTPNSASRPSPALPYFF
jgi:hypothetical protein